VQQTYRSARDDGQRAHGLIKAQLPLVVALLVVLVKGKYVGLVLIGSAHRTAAAGLEQQLMMQ
jgi:hypothetical protein